MYYFSFVSLYFFYLNINRDFENKNLSTYHKGVSINKIVDLILTDENFINKKIYSSYLKLFNKYYDTIKFGEFKIENKLNLIQITNIISKPSNVYKDLHDYWWMAIYQLEKLKRKI